MNEYWSNLVTLYLGFVTISFRCCQTVPVMAALYQAFRSSLCFWGSFILFYLGLSLLFTMLKGDVYYKSARISLNGIKVE